MEEEALIDHKYFSHHKKKERIFHNEKVSKSLLVYIFTSVHLYKYWCFAFSEYVIFIYF